MFKYFFIYLKTTLRLNDGVYCAVYVCICQLCFATVIIYCLSVNHHLAFSHKCKQSIYSHKIQPSLRRKISKGSRTRQTATTTKLFHIKNKLKWWKTHIRELMKQLIHPFQKYDVVMFTINSSSLVLCIYFILCYYLCFFSQPCTREYTSLSKILLMWFYCVYYGLISFNL